MSRLRFVVALAVCLSGAVAATAHADEPAVPAAAPAPAATAATPTPTAAATTAATAPAPADAQPAAAAAAAKAKKKVKPLGRLVLDELLPIALLLVAIAFVIRRLPRIEIAHSAAFRRRRLWNWLPLGLTYAFLYMGRYNLNSAKDVGFLTLDQYGEVFGVGSLVYGLAFLLNGPLTDRWGGRTTILLAAGGSAICNAAMGLFIHGSSGADPVLSFSILYGANMYFQSFGAVSIVKVNSSWFHVRERGVFGGIFGILISLGLYFAYDWSARIASRAPLEWVFFAPAGILLLFFVIDLRFVRNSPADVGHPELDTGDASSGDRGPPLRAFAVIKRMLTNKVIVTIALIEFCSGYLRNAVMQWYRDYAKGVGAVESFAYQNWGMLLCIAGITGGVVAGIISDRVFHSRRGPVAALLYGVILTSAGAMLIFIGVPPAIAVFALIMSMAYIGVHGMLSGTASQDFGGSKNAGIATGIIDAFVYFGSSVQAHLLGSVLPSKEAAHQASNWTIWPLAMLPVAALGLLLATRVWHARPAPRAAGH